MEERILILDDNYDFAESLKDILEPEEYKIKITTNSRSFFLSYESFKPDLILLDIHLDNSSFNGLEVLETIQNRNVINSKIIVISGEKDQANFKKAFELGASNFIEKSANLKLDSILIDVKQTLRLREQEKTSLNLQVENVKYFKEYKKKYEFIGETPEIRKVKSQIMKLAQSEADILITGETGTGKEIVAHNIYTHSKQFGNKFETINCAAIPPNLVDSVLFGHKKGAFTGADADRKGLFEKAEGGFLFLDEISKLSLDGQAKILRAIEQKEIRIIGGETKKVNVRLIFASNNSISDLREQDNFREDLFYRIEGNVIALPPLKKRKRDHYRLGNFFLDKYSKKNGAVVKTDLKKIYIRLKKYKWPGNVREFENFFRSLTIHHKVIDNRIILEEIENKIINMKVEKKIGNISLDGKLKPLLDKVEKKYLMVQLRENKWNISRTSRVVGIDRTTLYKKIDKHNIKIRR